jgi:hypothetical protein
MISLTSRRAIAACLAAVVCVGVSARAQAQGVNCADVGGAAGRRIYLTGSTAAAPFMATVGRALASGASPIYLIYQNTRGSCDGVHAMLDGAPVPLAGTATYYDPAIFAGDGGAIPVCNLGAAPVDVGVSDVYQDSCVDFADIHTLPPGVRDFLGPNQVMTFVVPAASSQTIISRDAAYLIYGFGATTNPVAPWTDHNLIFQRTAASGTQSMISIAIGVPAARWAGILSPRGGSGGNLRDSVLDQNANAANAEATIGILAADVADQNRASGPTTGLKILAYQHAGQSCAYYPDASPTSLDKINVRDGHYPIWGPLHFLTTVGTDGRPTNADVATLMDFLTSVAPPAELLQAEIAASVVPQCAMKVTRFKEVGPYVPYRPPNPCGCFFDTRVGAGAVADCTACGDATPCAAGKICSYGYCEDP